MAARSRTKLGIARWLRRQCLCLRDQGGKARIIDRCAGLEVVLGDLLVVEGAGRR
jgi:hypothetical protein